MGDFKTIPVDKKKEILEKKNLKVLIILHILIWSVFSVKNGILWYYLEPENLGLIVRYKIYEFSVIGGISSFIIYHLFKLSVRYSKNNYQLVVGYIITLYISLSFFIIITGISFNAIIFSRLELFHLAAYMKGLTFYLFLFLLLSLTPYLVLFWQRYKEQIIKNKSLILNQKKNDDEAKKELSGKVFLSSRHLPNYLEQSAIKYIQADAYISHIITDKNKKITLDRSLKKWENELPQKTFSRIHKSVIVNTNYITKIEKLPNQTYQVYMKDVDEILNMSRRFGKSFTSNPQYQHLF